MTCQPKRLFLLPFACSLALSSLELSRDQKQLSEVAVPEDKTGIVSEASRCVLSDQYQVTAIDSEKSFDFSTEEFNFTSSVSIDRVIGLGEEVLSSYSVDEGNLISCIITNFVDCTDIKLSFYRQGELIDTCMLYFAISEEGLIHSSSLSLDTARRAAGQEVGYNLAYDEENESESSYLLNNESTISLLSLGASGSIYGTLKRTDEQGNTHPLVGAKILVTMSMSWWSESTYTDENGYYKIEYNDIWHLFGGIPTVHVYTEGESVKVHNDGIYEKTHEFSSGEGGEFSYTFSPAKNGDMGMAMMVFQGAKNFADYAQYLNGGTAIDFCNFKFPADTTKCYYSGETVYIYYKEGLTSSCPSTYAAWDTIGHEYGHHVQKVFGIADNPGGGHGISENNIDRQYEDGYSLSEAKNRGHRLSWAEGWATYWSTLAQYSFPDDLRTIYTVGDTSYTSRSFTYDLDESASNSKGDASELAIQRILYKLYSPKTDEIDKFSISELKLWDIVTSYQPTSFFSFVEALYEEGYNKHNLALLLSEYNVITGTLSIANCFKDTTPTFSWSTYMGSEYLFFNQFDLYFVDSYGNEIDSATNISSSDTTVSYTVSSSLWEQVCNASSDDRFYTYIVFRQTTSYISGNYISELFTFEKPASYSSSKIQITPDEWGFQGRYYFPSEIKNITSLENDANNIRYSNLSKSSLLIETERLRCGYIEDSYINLSPRREDAGEAYFAMNFSQPVYSFLYSICLWSSSENLDGMAILQVKYDSDQVIWSTVSNLQSDISLTTRSEGLKRYSHYFKSGICALRFYATATATGSRNKGRLCIDDIVLSTNSNTSANHYYYTAYPKTGD